VVPPGVVAQLDKAIDAVGSSDLSSLDHEELALLSRRLEAIVDRATSSLSDVDAARCMGASTRTVRMRRSLDKAAPDIAGLAEGLSTGAISYSQAVVIVANPEVGAKLVAEAPGKSTQDLRRAAARLHNDSGEGEAGKYRRLHGRRSCVTWVDGEGLFNILAKFAPADAAPFVTKLKAEERRFPREAGATPSAHRADALLSLVTNAQGNGVRSLRVKPVVNIHVDRESLSRGWVEGDGFCEISGLGSVPVGRAWSVFDEAMIRVLVTSGNRLVWAGDTNKPLPSRVRDAVLAQKREICAICGDRATQLDHVMARVNSGDHDIDNLQPLCDECHAEKTLKDVPWAAKYRNGGATRSDGSKQPRAGPDDGSAA
jgi:hypothetical protein